MSTAPRKTNDAWTEYETPWVTEVPGEPFRYLVESLSEPGVAHTVELTQRHGHGACTCHHFNFVASANYRRHGNWIPYAPKRAGVSECKHIRAAWDYYHLNVTIPMMNRIKNGIPSL